MNTSISNDDFVLVNNLLICIQKNEMDEEIKNSNDK